MTRILAAAALCCLLSACSATTGDMGTAMGKAAADLILQLALPAE